MQRLTNYIWTTLCFVLLSLPISARAVESLILVASGVQAQSEPVVTQGTGQLFADTAGELYHAATKQNSVVLGRISSTGIPIFETDIGETTTSVPGPYIADDIKTNSIAYLTPGAWTLINKDSGLISDVVQHERVSLIHGFFIIDDRIIVIGRNSIVYSIKEFDREGRTASSTDFIAQSNAQIINAGNGLIVFSWVETNANRILGYDSSTRSIRFNFTNPLPNAIRSSIKPDNEGGFVVCYLSGSQGKLVRYDGSGTTLYSHTLPYSPTEAFINSSYLNVVQDEIILCKTGTIVDPVTIEFRNMKSGLISRTLAIPVSRGGPLFFSGAGAVYFSLFPSANTIVGYDVYTGSQIYSYVGSSTPSVALEQFQGSVLVRLIQTIAKLNTAGTGLQWQLSPNATFAEDFRIYGGYSSSDIINFYSTLSSSSQSAKLVGFRRSGASAYSHSVGNLRDFAHLSQAATNFYFYDPATNCAVFSEMPSSMLKRMSLNDGQLLWSVPDYGQYQAMRLSGSLLEFINSSLSVKLNYDTGVETSRSNLGSFGSGFPIYEPNGTIHTLTGLKTYSRRSPQGTIEFNGPINALFDNAKLRAINSAGNYLFVRGDIAYIVSRQNGELIAGATIPQSGFAFFLAFANNRLLTQSLSGTSKSTLTAFDGVTLANLWTSETVHSGNATYCRVSGANETARLIVQNDSNSGVLEIINDFGVIVRKTYLQNISSFGGICKFSDSTYGIVGTGGTPFDCKDIIYSTLEPCNDFALLSAAAVGMVKGGNTSSITNADSDYLTVSSNNPAVISYHADSAPAQPNLKIEAFLKVPIGVGKARLSIYNFSSAKYETLFEKPAGFPLTRFESSKLMKSAFRSPKDGSYKIMVDVYSFEAHRNRNETRLSVDSMRVVSMN